jgi:hypothetical protein
LGRVECIAIDGLDLWFNSHDHPPPHFHVGRTAAYELRVYFLLCTDTHLDFDLKWGSGPSTKVLKELRELAVQNRVALLEEWERKVCQP